MSPSIPPRPNAPAAGIYRHFKGGLYEVVPECMEVHSETLAWHIRYRALPSGEWWTRPRVSFTGTIANGDRRFTPLTTLEAYRALVDQLREARTARGSAPGGDRAYLELLEVLYDQLPYAEQEVVQGEGARGWPGWTGNG